MIRRSTVQVEDQRRITSKRQLPKVSRGWITWQLAVATPEEKFRILLHATPRRSSSPFTWPYLRVRNFIVFLFSLSCSCRDDLRRAFWANRQRSQVVIDIISLQSKRCIIKNKPDATADQYSSLLISSSSIIDRCIARLYESSDKNIVTR